MPTTPTSTISGSRAIPGPKHPPRWAIGTACALGMILVSVAFFAYSPYQTSVITTQPRDSNPVGYVGAYGAFVSFFSFGLAAWFLPVFLFWISWLAFRQPKALTTGRFIAMAICLFTGAGLAAPAGSFLGLSADHGFVLEYPRGAGGVIGQLLYRGLLRGTLGVFGSVLLLGVVYVAGLLVVFTGDIGAEFERMHAAFNAWRQARAERKALLAGASSKTSAPPKPEPKPQAKEPLVLTPVGPANKNILIPKSGEARAKPEPKDAPPARQAAPLELNIVKPAESKKVKAPALARGDDRYRPPPIPLLREPVRVAAGHNEDEHRVNAENLLRILSEFGVDVTLGEIHVGPVITRYELVPAPGVRVEKISGLDKNIALGMRAQSVRILAPIPGKAAVGVEVPNQNPTPVGLREILESEEWAGSKYEIPIALGKDVSGKPLISDLTKMPHLLIAGATGSGKSVCINAIVASILYSKSPSDLRLIMVDPKVVELKIFNSLPHMLIPVLTEPKKVPAALKWLLREMEQRYQIFAKVNVRNIVAFNNRKKSPPDDAPPPPETQPGLEGIDPLGDGIEVPERMPYIVAIVDELADLMMIAPAEIETNIARLAQLARAAGIHLIIATQRPSVNVVTGIIKANLPSRIAFQVASQVDSRTIIDTKGADTLIGRGDMLFTPPGTSRIVRAQGAYVADEEIQAIVDFLRLNNDPPIYAQAVQQHIDRAAQEEEEEEGGQTDEGEDGDDDQLVRQAIDVLRATRRASTSMLQRRLRIGYNRAARIMELMEDRGIVGPENGSSPREILVDLDKLEP